MECELNKPNAKCVWKRYGKQILPDDRYKIESKDCVQRLLINDATLQDSASISCVCLGIDGDDEVATTGTKLIIEGQNKYKYVFRIKFSN